MILLDQYSAPILARIHKESIDPPWSEESFRSLLVLPAVAGFAHPDFSSFILFSIIDDEAEVLTFATQKKFRRKGYGRTLLDECIRTIFNKKIEKIFLEVDENNFAAIALYEQLDFKKYGVRENYYIDSKNKVSNAVLMRRER